MHTHRRINALLLCMILSIYKTGACVPNTHNLHLILGIACMTTLWLPVLLKSCVHVMSVGAL